MVRNENMCGVREHAYLPTGVSVTSAESFDVIEKSSFNLFMELFMSKNVGWSNSGDLS